MLSTSPAIASLLISRSTGPGLPFFNADIALLIWVEISELLVIDECHLVIWAKLVWGSKFGFTSATFAGDPAGRYRTGTASAHACANPPKEFSIPGPPWEQKTPLLPSLANILAYPSAAIIPPRSCLNTIGLNPPLPAASINGLAGKHAIHSNPSFFNISTTAS